MKSLVLISLICVSQSCYLYNVDYKGTNLNEEHQLKTEDASTCQTLCQKEPRCYFWTWVTPDFQDGAYRKDCYLKSSDVVMASQDGLISGPKECSNQECCQDFEIETVGGGNFYQEERMGKYGKIGNSQDGRNVYRQQNGDNYLYYITDRGVRFSFLDPAI